MGERQRTHPSEEEEEEEEEWEKRTKNKDYGINNELRKLDLQHNIKKDIFKVYTKEMCWCLLLVYCK
jgi:hypothetical protein